MYIWHSVQQLSRGNNATIFVHPRNVTNLARSFTFQTLTVLSGYVSLLTNETLVAMSRNLQHSWHHTNMFFSRALKDFRFSVGDGDANSSANWRY